MKLKWWQAVILLLAFYLAFYGGLGRADVIDDVQEVIIVLDNIQESLWEFMPVDDFRVYITTKEIGVKWTF